MHLTLSTERRHLSATILVLAFGYAGAPLAAQVPLRAEWTPTVEAPLLVPISDLAQARVVEHQNPGRALLGAAIGWPAGVLAGAALGYLTGPRDDIPTDCMFWCAPTGPIVGGLLGSILGPPIGAHLLNNRAGRPVLSSFASAASSVGGFLAVRYAVQEHGVPATLVLLIPLAQVSSATLIEWATAQ